MTERPEKASARARFGGFEVDVRSGELTRQGHKVPLAAKPLQVLLALLEQPGELVTREELCRRLWSDDTFVDFDNNMNAAVSRLREALNDSAQAPRFVETIPRRGYRYVGPPPVWDGDESVPPRPTASGWRVQAAILGAVLLILALAVALFVTDRRSRAPESHTAPVGDRIMLAVLPFENLTGDAANDYLADGLTEELLTLLGGVAPEQLGVIARTSVRRYKGSERSVAEIGAELGVDHLVEGAVRAEGERLRISAQLVRVGDETHLWAQSYDRAATSLLDLQMEIASSVVAAILPRLEPSLPASEAGPEAAQAYLEYLQGRFELAKDQPEAVRRAIVYFESAVDREPEQARYWVGLAEALNIDWFAADSPEAAAKIRNRAGDAARRALEQEPTLTEAYVALAFSELYHEWDVWGAVEALTQPLEGMTNSAQAYQLAAAAFAAMARHDDALALTEQALELDPASVAAQATQGWYLLFAGRFFEAEERCRAVLAEFPDHPGASECLYQALLRTSREAEAVRVLGRRLLGSGVPEERFQDVDPDNPEEAIPAVEQIRLDQIFATREEDPAAPFDAAVAFARRGEIDRALAGLEMALQRRDSRLLFLAVDPRFEALHGEPRFQEFLRSVGIQK